MKRNPKLTDKQIEMIYEMSDIHYKWFEIYSPGTKYKEVLKLNHKKMLSIVKGCNDCSEEMIDFIFESIIRDYSQMLSDYSK